MESEVIFFAAFMLIGIMIAAHYCKKSLSKYDFENQYKIALKHSHEKFIQRLKSENHE